MTDDRTARRVQVRGIVQGVGFRPFIFQLAENYGLHGRVANTAAGVDIHIEGDPAPIDAFIAAIEAQAPPLAQITSVESRAADPDGVSGFRISASRSTSGRATLISPDVSICADCLRELRDPQDRRFGYPFINCTNCGPRYTIIDDIPYDRPKTSMRSFRMCAACQAEYDNPRDRRFHAQPNACGDCGPQVALEDGNGAILNGEAAIHRAAALLADGKIVALKGLGGYHLTVDASNNAAVERLRRRKQREEKPLALMAPSLEAIRSFAWIDPEERDVLTSPQRPIVLLRKRRPHPVAPAVSPRNAWFGVMLPYTPLHALLLAHGFKALVMTSGNLSEEPIAIANTDARARLAPIADALLTHDRKILLRCDDSIVRKTDGVTRFLRRSRGYVPVPVFLRRRQPPVLACGGELKNTVCLLKEDRAFVSQHIGDLENLATYEFFQATIDHLQRILDITPDVLACDLHPDYLSTRYARERDDLPLVQVQHHHAHIVSTMAENHLEGPVIGLAFDGTGYGPDGTVWGGEILTATPGSFERAASLEPVPMPGSAAAIREPWRMAVSYLAHSFGDRYQDLDIPFWGAIDPDQAAILVAMGRQDLNAPLTSSLGRLFDGVAALIGLRHRVAFEGQAAMELEMTIGDDDPGVYDHGWRPGGDRRLIEIAPIIAGVVADLARGVPGPLISRRFHTTLTALFASLCGEIRDQTGLDRVALSGGVFQNAVLSTELARRLARDGFQVYTQRLVPANDGGLSLGQAVAAAAMWADGG
ncbi:MAG: carbamoyltransferase HypF [Desulfobacterales bacterium]|nr:carbamoyltransferase HypF [Desulfobacterales bacterium]